MLDRSSFGYNPKNEQHSRFSDSKHPQLFHKQLNAVRVPLKYSRGKAVKFLPSIDQDINEEQLHNLESLNNRMS